MTDRYYNGEFGATKVDIVEDSSSTAGADVELRITYDATGNSKNAALLVLEAIKQRLIEDSWPPA